MFNKTSEQKSDPDRLGPSARLGASLANQQVISKTNRRISHEIAASALHQHYLNYYSNSIPKEETKSQLSQRRHQQQLNNNPLYSTISTQPFGDSNMQQNHSVNHSRGEPQNQAAASFHHHHHHHHHNINSSPNVTTTTSNLSTTRSVPRDDNISSTNHSPYNKPNQMKPQRTFSSSAILSTSATSSSSTSSASMSIPQQNQKDDPSRYSTTNPNPDRALKEEITMAETIKEELEHDLDANHSDSGPKESDLDAVSSLERNLPIELSFLIKQQAYCMARMNYLDRQIRELKETASAHQDQLQQQTPQVSSSTSSGMMLNHTTATTNHNHFQQQQQQHQLLQQQQHQYPNMNMSRVIPMTHAKNGNFILSDDSGGDYSRATISDDDELSSLLDQIAKSVRPERGNIQGNNISNIVGGNNTNGYSIQNHHHHQPKSHMAANYSTIISSQPQQYAIVNSNHQQQQQHQVVPIFVMGSPIAVAHPTSSINSNVLPGVHFQPEPRYNQYYNEGLNYYNATNSSQVTNSAASLVNGVILPPPPQHHHHAQQQPQHQQQQFQQRNMSNTGFRSQQQQHFDSSISAIEQLVSQKEKLQIRSQLKSADNWLKMRANGAVSNELSLNGGINGLDKIMATSKTTTTTPTAATSTTNSNGTTSVAADRNLGSIGGRNNGAANIPTPVASSSSSTTTTTASATMVTPSTGHQLQPSCD